LAAPLSENTPSQGQQDVARPRSANEKPADGSAAALHRENRFSIDDGDWQTKRTLTAVMFCFTLESTGGAENLPLVTIPAQ
jgi:hypothetical protein